MPSDASAKLAERDGRVAYHHMVDRKGPRCVERLDVELDERLPDRVEEVGGLVDRVGRTQLGADRERQIRIRERRVGRIEAEGPQHAKGQRMVLRKDALA